MKKMSSDDTDARVVRGRELARLARRQAYQRAKELRAKDPRYLAMKQLAKEQRREASKAAREKRKAGEAAARTAEKKAEEARRTAERARRDAELKKLLMRGSPSQARAVTSSEAGREALREAPIGSSSSSSEAGSEAPREAPIGPSSSSSEAGSEAPREAPIGPSSGADGEEHAEILLRVRAPRSEYDVN